MMAGNLSIEQRKWIVKHYWKTENAERVSTAWGEAFNTPPPSRLTFYHIRDKFDAMGSVANAQKSGRPRKSMTEENEMRVPIIFVNCPKKSTRRAAQELSLPRTSLPRLMRKLNLKPYRSRPLWRTAQNGGCNSVKSCVTKSLTNETYLIRSYGQTRPV
jgi:hypothetical protein